MDPLTALSIASSVVQFVDFGSKLLSNSRKLYKSSHGILSENLDIEDVTQDLRSLLQGLKRKLPEDRLLRNVPPSDAGQRSDDDEALDHLCRRSVTIAEDLLKRLNKLTVKPLNEDGQDDVSVPLPEIAKSRRDRAWRLLGGSEMEPPRKMQFRKWESFRKALEASWDKKEIETTAATLREYRSEMEFRILVRFRRVLTTNAGVLVWLIRD
jgi:hypothetical protein